MSFLPWLEINPPLQKDELQEWVQIGSRFSSYNCFYYCDYYFWTHLDFFNVNVHGNHTRRNTITLVITHFLFLHTFPDARRIPHMVSLRIFSISLISSPRWWSYSYSQLRFAHKNQNDLPFATMATGFSVFELGPAPGWWATFLAVPWRLLKTLLIQRDLGTPAQKALLCRARLCWLGKLQTILLCKTET